MREHSQRAIALSLAALTLAVWACSALGFHFESYALCGEPALYAWACDPADTCVISVEPIQFNLMQQVESAGSCTYASCVSYVETGECHFSFSGRAESWTGCDSAEGYVHAGIYPECGGSELFAAIVRQDPGDPPTCTLSFNAWAAAQRGFYAGGINAADAGISLRLNGHEIVAGSCGLWGTDECAWDSTGTVQVVDGDYLEYAARTPEIQAAAYQCAPFWAEANLTVELLDYCISSVATGDDLTPQTACLHQNRPNPFTTETTVSFDLPACMHVRLAVYTPLGQQLSLLVDEVMPAGRNTVVWRGADDRGSNMPPGIYFCHLEAGGISETRKMLLLE